MRKLVVVGMIALVTNAVQAEGYIGASLGRGKMSFDCTAGASCRENVNVFKLYAGTRLSDAEEMSFGAARVDGVEVAYLRTLKGATSLSMIEQSYLFIEPDGSGTVLDRVVPSRQKLSIDAIAMAPVLSAQVTENFRVFAKPGLALVTASIDSEINGQRIRQDSSVRLNPYISLGANYAVVTGVKVFGSFDMVGYRLKSERGTVQSLNLGAEVDF